MKPIVSGYCEKLRRTISYTPNDFIETTSHSSTSREYILSGLFNCPEYGDHVANCPFIESCDVAKNYNSKR